jgi:UDP-N-acetyl-D-galactosamine dehydrogenase
VVDIVNALKTYNANVSIYDPWANPAEVLHEYGTASSTAKPAGKYDAVILAVAHDEFKNLDLSDFTKANSVVYDVKGFWDGKMVDGRL